MKGRKRDPTLFVGKKTQLDKTTVKKTVKSSNFRKKSNKMLREFDLDLRIAIIQNWSGFKKFLKFESLSTLRIFQTMVLKFNRIAKKIISINFFLYNLYTIAFPGLITLSYPVVENN